jgi:hypothetical protein
MSTARVVFSRSSWVVICSSRAFWPRLGHLAQQFVQVEQLRSLCLLVSQLFLGELLIRQRRIAIQLTRMVTSASDIAWALFLVLFQVSDSGRVS